MGWGWAGSTTDSAHRGAWGNRESCGCALFVVGIVVYRTAPFRRVSGKGHLVLYNHLQGANPSRINTGVIHKFLFSQIESPQCQKTLNWSTSFAVVAIELMACDHGGRSRLVVGMLEASGREWVVGVATTASTRETSEAPMTTGRSDAGNSS